MLKRLYSFIIKKIGRKRHSDFIRKLRMKGIEVGKGCKFFSPRSVVIDTQRPHMLHIGDYVKVTQGVTILCHDYSRSVLVMSHHENIGEAGKTWIGDNVFIGIKTIILMGTYIGDNSIVGAGSVVSGKFPPGVVIAGNPARVICTVEEYAKKRRKKTLEEAVLYVKEFKKKNNINPNIQQMTNAFSWLYIPHTQESIDKYPQFFQLSGVDQKQMKEDFLSSKPQFKSFDEFLQYVSKC